MEIQFTFLGLNCLATGEMENGKFIPEAISAIGDIDIGSIPSNLHTSLMSVIDKSVDELLDPTDIIYADPSQHFGEDLVNS